MNDTLEKPEGTGVNVLGRGTVHVIGQSVNQK